ncbi:hypothetical protein [Streptomyces bauhiniae]
MRLPFGGPRKPEGTPALSYWRQPAWQLSAVFMILALLVSLFGLLRGGSPSADSGLSGAELKDARPLTRSGGPGTGTSARDSGRPQGCVTDDQDTGLPKVPPGDVQWRGIAGVKVPTSASAGPLLASGPLWWCFAHTPSGAAMAAHVVTAQMRGPAWRAVADRQLTAGFGRDFLVAMNARRATSAPAPASYGYAGFRVVSYTAAKATVELLVKDDQAALTATEVSLVWNDGDWKVVPRSDGTLFPLPAAVEDTRDFVKWRV